MQWSWSIDSRSIAIGFPSTGWGVYLRRRDAVVQWSESVVRSYHGERWREWPSERIEKKSVAKHIVHGCALIGNVSNFHESKKWILWGDSIVFLYPGRMAADDPLCNEPLVSVEFEVFGKVQGKSEVLSGRRSSGIRLMSFHLKRDFRWTFPHVTLARLRVELIERQGRKKCAFDVVICQL